MTYQQHSWEDVQRVAASLGFKRAGFGSRMEGFGWWIEHPETGHCKVTCHSEALRRPFSTTLTLDSTAAWLLWNDWS
jgi:hypothetical protein